MLYRVRSIAALGSPRTPRCQALAALASVSRKQTTSAWFTYATLLVAPLNVAIATAHARPFVCAGMAADCSVGGGELTWERTFDDVLEGEA